MLSTEELESKKAELLRLHQYTDDLVGPWYYADGTPFVVIGLGWRRSRVAPGRAPEHHPRRCHRRSCQTDRRCGKWSEPGREFCRFHGGKKPLIQLSKLPALYSKHLRPTLATRLEEFLGSKQREQQLELYEEIALARTLLTEALDIARLLGEDPKVAMEIKITAAGHVKCQLEQVASLCARAAQIEKNLADRVSLGSLGMFVEQITRILYERLGTSEVAQQLAEDLKQLSSLDRDAGLPLDRVVEVSYG